MKRSYQTEEGAKNHLEHIILSNHKPWKTTGNKKPIRYYEQDGLWYLTSQPIITQY